MANSPLPQGGGVAARRLPSIPEYQIHDRSRFPTAAAPQQRRMPRRLPISSRGRRSSSPPRRCITTRPRSTCWSRPRSPNAGDVSLDVACGPGSVVLAFARRVRRAVGLDATEAMLAEARKLAAARGRAERRVAPGRRLRASLRGRRVRHRQLPLRVPPPAGAGPRVRRDDPRVPPRRPHRGVRCGGLRRPGQGRRAQRHGAASRSLHGGVPPAPLPGACSRRGPAGAKDELLRRAGRARAPGRHGLSGQRRSRAAAGDDRRAVDGDTMGVNARREGARCGSSIRPWCWWR